MHPRKLAISSEHGENGLCLFEARNKRISAPIIVYLEAEVVF